MSLAPSPARSKSRRRIRAFARWSLVVICVLVTVVSSMAAWVIRQSFPHTDGELSLPGLSAKVDVVRDDWGVPQIYADTSHDLFTAQGYVHAQDRFFEMDFRRHVTSGRLSEMFGESQVETDATIRTMGWRRVAEAEWELLGEATKGYFTAYADGVNAYLKDKSPDEVSLEYTMLGLTGLDYEIEPWNPVDGLTWLKAMAWDLKGNYTDEINRALLTASGLSPEQVSDVYPPYPFSEHLPIVTEGTVADGVFSQDAIAGDETARVPTTASVDGHDALQRVAEATDSLKDVLGNGGADGIGSNSWVIGGELTETGKPLLANDPHLGAAMPSVWYQVGLRCREVNADCPFDVAGFSFSGVPGVMIGHNGQISWGFTNLGPDVTDFYLERLDGDKYLVDDEWRDLEIREETIEVSGGEPVTISVRSTGHGPLMSDRGGRIGDAAKSPPDVEEDGEYGMALRWTALDPGRTADAIFALNTAGDFEDFRAAAAAFEVPAQNLVYADLEGNIGYQSPGRIPVRGKGDGTMPVPGWDSAYDWTGYIAFDELPSVLNPDEGFIVTANNAVIADQYPYLLTQDWAYGYRSQQIRDMITDTDGPISAADIARMQMDSANMGAPPVIEAIGNLPMSDKPESLERLERWDLQQTQDSPAAAFYNTIWRHLLLNTFDELPKGMEPGGGERWAQVVGTIVKDENNPWWDVQATSETETMTDMLDLAVTMAQAELTERFGEDVDDWRWGDMHTLTVTHQSLGASGIDLVESLFNASPISTSGGDGIVNATGWDAASGYEVDAVPSMRMIVDMSDLDDSLWINLTGNSGHALHKNYADQLPLWQNGELLPMAWSTGQVEEAATQKLTLVP